jgi:hypothetical protein
VDKNTGNYRRKNHETHFYVGFYHLTVKQMQAAVVVRYNRNHYLKIEK